ncbi:hypothetical protein PAF17_13155 [Paracoccus sp. Z330]|uniref:Semialdehyde dehydrogenase NAD-binding domain-containing protein n=1 Tax=Paracoccus onchidii TaxID=3017813 RepID=A0ABT4ZGL4_9RHOB|nr:hypothetical protein [Paracoccus onchidii]MDB6178446.1 hypothetical protein [Paracoccus onchidii]
MTKKLSVLGALGLLGQHLIARLLRESSVEIVSLHDHRHGESARHVPWFANPDARDFALRQPILAPEAKATGDLILSFLPDDGAEAIERQHLQRGARIVSHCEYARQAGLLLAPGLPLPDTRGHQLVSTPNCTTAMCAAPLAQLHQSFGIEAVHVTTLQAVSGTDLPGMPAYLAHDNVVSSLPGEALALETELNTLFDAAFPVTCIATRVPVWRGHTLSLMVQLRNEARRDEIARLLAETSGIGIRDARENMPLRKPENVDGDTLGVIDTWDLTDTGWLKISLRGDNLGMATTGLMSQLAKDIPLAGT